MSVEYGISTKLLEILKEIAPGTTRAVVVAGGLGAPGGIGQFTAIRDAAPSFGVEVTALDLRDREGVHPTIVALARERNGGLIVPVSALAMARREEIIALAAQHALPAVYGRRVYVTGGGLISYGPAMIDLYRRAASYVDRILKGEKPADLPVQAPTKYETVINLNTAKTLGLAVPPNLLAVADEVIE
jgi:putative ABC transport system substrate-binding protein